MDRSAREARTDIRRPGWFVGVLGWGGGVVGFPFLWQESERRCSGEESITSSDRVRRCLVAVDGLYTGLFGWCWENLTFGSELAKRMGTEHQMPFLKKMRTKGYSASTSTWAWAFWSLRRNSTLAKKEAKEGIRTGTVAVPSVSCSLEFLKWWAWFVHILMWPCTWHMTERCTFSRCFRVLWQPACAVSCESCRSQASKSIVLAAWLTSCASHENWIITKNPFLHRVTLFSVQFFFCFFSILQSTVNSISARGCYQEEPILSSSWCVTCLRSILNKLGSVYIQLAHFYDDSDLLPDGSDPSTVKPGGGR